MKKIKYLSLIMILTLVLTGCGDKTTSSGGIDNGSNKEVKYYSNAETIYFNAETGKKCNNYEESNSDTKNTSGCLKWYLYSDNGDGTINLLLDHNITNHINWAKDGEGKNGPSKEFLNTLKETTNKWAGVKDRKDKYTLSQNYTIDYKCYKARLISEEENMNIIVQYTSKLNYNTQIYFDKDNCDYNKTNNCSYGWLFDRTQSDCSSYGCLNDGGHSYWTSTAFIGSQIKAWEVTLNFVYPASTEITDTDLGNLGIRPVITIDKSLIK